MMTRAAGIFACLLAGFVIVTAGQPAKDAPKAAGRQPIPVSSVPVGAFFRLQLPYDPNPVWMLVHPPQGDGQATTSTYGIGYQPTSDGNSVYAVAMDSGRLFRMQAKLTAVLEPGLTLQFRYDRSDHNYHTE